MRYFSIAEANAAVPYLQLTFERVRARLAETERLTAQLLARGDRSQPDAPIPDELPADHRELRARRDEAVRAIAEALGNVVELGIHVKRPDGLVDFPTRRGGKLVYLCWRFGEREVTHWHDLAEGFAGRREIGAQRFEASLPN